MSKVHVTFLDEDDVTIFGSEVSSVPKAGDTVYLSLVRSNESFFRDDVWESYKENAEKGWEVVRVHHEFLPFNSSTTLQSIFIYVKPATL